MNKKTFAVAFIFLCVTVAWLVINIVWWTSTHKTGELFLPVVFVCVAAGMVYRQSKTKQRRHIEDVKRHIK